MLIVQWILDYFDTCIAIATGYMLHFLLLKIMINYLLCSGIAIIFAMATKIAGELNTTAIAIIFVMATKIMIIIMIMILFIIMIIIILWLLYYDFNYDPMEMLFAGFTPNRKIRMTFGELWRAGRGQRPSAPNARTRKRFSRKCRPGLPMSPWRSSSPAPTPSAGTRGRSRNSQSSRFFFLSEGPHF